MEPYQIALLSAAALGLGLAFGSACGDSDLADGADCSSSGDCASNVCLHGRCAGRACSCEGASCPAGQCDDGWVCTTRGEVPGLSCTRACDPAGGCPSGERCDLDLGVCVAGVSGPTLSWVTRPGAARCALGQACRYAVRADGDRADAVRSYVWTFGDAGVDDAGAEVEYRYPVAGSYRVEVRAVVDGNGATPTLDGEERVCIGDQQHDCSGTPGYCCAGSCTLAGQCR